MSWPHWIIVPVALPLLVGALLLLVERRARPLVAPIALGSTLVQLLVAIGLLQHAAGGEVSAYLLGNWRVPFGIALALDRLSAMMLLVTAGVALATLVYARGDDARRSPHFYALFQFQLMGLNGAFLTADLFNLFVFFEVLLIASYGLLLHGAGPARLRASFHYVSFNVAAAGLFLIAVSLLYAQTGTLNMADLAMRVPELTGSSARLAGTAALVLLVVFCVKAALLPLYFWLPDTYSSATAPVAALFAIMTKVGVYAIARVYTLVFGASGGEAADVAYPWLPVLALGTLALAALGVLGAVRVRIMVAYLIVVSAGILLLALGLGTEATVGAGLFYLVNTTFATAALFLLVDRICAARAGGEVPPDLLRAAPIRANRAALGAAFFTLAVAVASMPPLAGFMGKGLLLLAAWDTPLGGWTWAVLLAASFVIIVALARAGGTLFWSSAESNDDEGLWGGSASSVAVIEGHAPDGTQHVYGIGLLIAMVVAAALLAGPIGRYTSDTAAQLFERRPYIEAVLGEVPVPAVIDIRRNMGKPKKEPKR
ncbi:MAG: monovalent cation/H+ antiporter subunit D [Burkholderiales bacterium]|nr:MAG: monovalent cation/H+ antiporter subunit D [Burkholderiales bacterium]